VGKNYCDLAVSNNGQRFSVSSLDGKIQIWDLADRVILHELAAQPDAWFGTARGSEEKLFGLSLEFSPDDRLLVVTRPSVKAWDVATGAERLSFEPAKPALFSLYSPDGSQIAVYHQGGMHSLVQLDAERQHGERRELGYFLDWPTAFSPDGQLLASMGREGNARILNLRTGQKTIVKPVSTLFTVTSVAVGVLFAVWSVAWIMRGTDKQHPYRPFFDLLLLWTIFLSGLVLKIFGTRSIYDVYRPSLHFGMACFVCCLGFIVIWAVLGASRGPFRASGLFGLCGLAMAPLLLWEDFDWFIWQIILGMLALIVGLAVLLKIWREATGCQLVFLGVANSKSNSDTNSELWTGKRNSRSQYTLSDMLLWTTAIAVVVGVAMHFKPAALPTQVWLYAVMEGLAFAAVIATSCWAVLGTKYFVLRIVLLAVSLGHASMLQFLFTSINLVAPGWSMAQPSIIASLVSGSLLVFRYHEYRLLGRREIEAHHYEAAVLPGSLREP